MTTRRPSRTPPTKVSSGSKPMARLTHAIEGKRKEIEAKFSPIMQRVYAAAGGAPGGMPGGMPGGAGFPGGGMPDMSGAGGPPGGTAAGADGVDDLY